MVKAFLYLVLVAAAALGLAWFADNPGSLTVTWLGREIETSVFVAAVLMVSVVTVLVLVFMLIAWLVNSPRRMARYVRERRRLRGYDALRRGMFAIGAGDETSAARFAIEARRNLPNEPMTKLLRAQSAQLSGDRGTARRIFETLADEGDTQLLGLRGLFLEASYEGHTVAAKQFAERAVSLNPALPWAVHALFDMQCRERDWQGALETLAVARAYKHFGRKALDRRRAVLLTAQAMELQATQAAKALELATEAHRLAPGLVPAANIAGRLLAGQGASYKAARIIARTWQVMPHPDLAVTYAYARTGDSPRDRLARIKTLAAISPSHTESRVALALAACDAHDWEEARAALQPLLASGPTARVCALMARIEGSQKRDAGRVREWLARAVRAPRDPVWMADGVVSEEWAPISPVNGTLDAFEWSTPSDPSKGSADSLLEDVTALSLELEAVARSLPEAAAQPESRGQGTAPVPSAERTRIVDHTPATITPVETRSAAPVATPAPAVVVAPPAPPPAPQTPAAIQRETGAEIIPVRRPAEAAPAAAAREQAQTLQVTAEAPPRPAVAAPAVVKPAATVSAVPSVTPVRRTEPKIFVPDRAPDDPGPEPAEPDEAQTPLGRFLSSMKQQAT